MTKPSAVRKDLFNAVAGNSLLKTNLLLAPSARFTEDDVITLVSHKSDHNFVDSPFGERDREIKRRKAVAEYQITCGREGRKSPNRKVIQDLIRLRGSIR